MVGETRSLRQLAAPAGGHRETLTVRTGFIPLIDAAILFVAEELGFAAREGVRLDLVRDVSWSNLRDRLAFRQFDAAHLLGAMAVASQVGIGTNPFPLIAPIALGRGGNAVTLSRSLAEALDAIGAETATLRGEDALTQAQRLAVMVRRRRAAGQAPLVFAVVYPFSSHNYEFRFWLACGGIDPDRDVTMTVVPPSMTADALAAGAIDGFCVNAPWNVVSVAAKVGRIVAVKADIWPSSPEKVLGLRADWAAANADTVARLVCALDAAARWCDDAQNRTELAGLLALPRYLGADPAMLEGLLAGKVLVDGTTGRSRDIGGYLQFYGDHANFPWQSQALWIYSQMLRWGQVEGSPDNQRAAAGAFRPDLYRLALSNPSHLPPSDRRVEGLVDAGGAFMDARVFDPDRLADYVAGFAIRNEGNGNGLSHSAQPLD